MAQQRPSAVKFFKKFKKKNPKLMSIFLYNYLCYLKPYQKRMNKTIVFKGTINILNQTPDTLYVLLQIKLKNK